MTKIPLTLSTLFLATAALAQEPPKPEPAVILQRTIADRCAVRWTSAITPPTVVAKRVERDVRLAVDVKRRIARFDNGDVEVKYERIVLTQSAENGQASLATADFVARLLAGPYRITPAGARAGAAWSQDEEVFVKTDVAALDPVLRLPETLAQTVRESGAKSTMVAEQIMPRAVVATPNASVELVFTDAKEGRDRFSATLMPGSSLPGATLTGSVVIAEVGRQIDVNLRGSTTGRVAFAAANGSVEGDSSMAIECSRAILN
jgi:hypothetical protein